MEQGEKRKVTFEDYQKAMAELKEKHGSFKSANRHIFLFFFLVALGILLYLLSEKTIIPSASPQLRAFAAKALVPFIVAVGLFYLVLIAVKIIKSLRCPQCGKFFPKGELEKFGSFEGTGLAYTSGGDSYIRPVTNSVFWTECKKCGHLLWIVK